VNNNCIYNDDDQVYFIVKDGYRKEERGLVRLIDYINYIKGDCSSKGKIQIFACSPDPNPVTDRHETWKN